LPLRLPCLFPYLGIAEAADQMVVDHAGGLHEGIADRWDHESNPLLPSAIANNAGIVHQPCFFRAS